MTTALPVPKVTTLPGSGGGGRRRRRYERRKLARQQLAVVAVLIVALIITLLILGQQWLHGATSAGLVLAPAARGRPIVRRRLSSPHPLKEPS
jgi:hypothetical protein